MNTQTLHHLALENLRVGAAISRFAQQAPTKSFCCGLMDHLIQFHQVNAERLGDASSTDASHAEAALSSSSSDSAVPPSVRSALHSCQQLQWELIKKYQTVLQQGENLSPTDRAQLEDQFRELQKWVTGFEYNASIEFR